MVSAVAVLFTLLVIVEAVRYGWARVEKAQAAIEHFSLTERTLTLDEYRDEMRTGRFEPFSDGWHFRVRDDPSPVSHEIGHVLVLDLTGRLAGVEASDAFSRRIREFVERGERTVVVNLKGLTRIDSAGLGELIRFYCLITRHAGGTMVLVNAPRHFRDLMAICKSTGPPTSRLPAHGSPQSRNGRCATVHGDEDGRAQDREHLPALRHC